jgi:epoxyqueuosine reductase
MRSRRRRARLAAFVGGRISRADGLDGRADALARRSGGAVAGGAVGGDAGRSYTPDHDPLAVLERRDRGAISVYAQGRDYHDLVKKRLKRLGRWLIAGRAARSRSSSIPRR